MKQVVAILALLSVVFGAPAYAEGAKRGQHFLLADQDNNLVLDRNEFRRFINLLAKSGNRNAKRVTTFRLYSLAWATVDKDKDGRATRSELFNARTSHVEVNHTKQSAWVNRERGRGQTIWSVR